MKSKEAPIRVFGQRSIASSFISPSPDLPDHVDENGQHKMRTRKDTRVSLSEFLDRKLHKTHLKPATVQMKQRPFSWLVGPEDVVGSSDSEIGVKEGQTKLNSVLDKTVFEQFKHTSERKDDCMGTTSVDEAGCSNIDDVQDSRKRRNPFEGRDKEPNARKHLIVLGGDPASREKGREMSYIRNKEPKPLYNHYANGCGWWDGNMEGIDDEVVGSTEAWEGVGSTTLGGIVDWH